MRQASAEPGRTDEDEHRDVGFDAQFIKRIIKRITRRRAQRSGDAEAKESDALVDAAAQLFQAGRA